MLNDEALTPILREEESNYFSLSNIWKILLISFVSVVCIIIGYIVLFPNSQSSQSIKHMLKLVNDLPGCESYGSFSCPSEAGDMPSQYKDQKWNTPSRGDPRWVQGFQDMNKLVGYARQIYSSDKKQCTVTIYTRTAYDMSLTYYFDGVAQSSASKVFTSSYQGLLKVKIVGNKGETLELDDIDFMWNVTPLKHRDGDYRGGQKGAIVELFGWPDDDIALECKHIAEAGYLGVKIFPHQEQIMSSTPAENMMNPWYFMYQPVSYRLQGRMGTRDQLRNMINKCRSYGLRVYADAVVNHMTASGNDMSYHRDNNGGCRYWGNKTSSAGVDQSPFYTPYHTYQTNNYTGRGTNALEFPAVPYHPMDFHCDKAMYKWDDPNNINTGWLVSLADLDTSKDYVRQRIADFFVDMISIGFSGFRIDAAKHIHPDDLAIIFQKFKAGMGGSIPSDFISWLEVLTGGESWMLVQHGDYSFTEHFTNKMKAAGLTDNEIYGIKIWWSAYPVDPNNDDNTIDIRRKAIQNDDHDQQSPGSTSRSMGDQGCILIKGCSPDEHRKWEVKLFTSPNYAWNNDNDYPIRMVLSSYYFINNRQISSVPDGLSDCSLCRENCNSCISRKYAKAYIENAKAYEGSDYTRVHRDPTIISAMRTWVHL